MKMPSLPSNIKGSIGSVSGAVNPGGGQRGSSGDPAQVREMPLNLMASDIAFANDFKSKYRNFGASNTQHSNSNTAMLPGQMHQP